MIPCTTLNRQFPLSYVNNLEEPKEIPFVKWIRPETTDDFFIFNRAASVAIPLISALGSIAITSAIPFVAKVTLGGIAIGGLILVLIRYFNSFSAPNTENVPQSGSVQEERKRKKIEKTSIDEDQLSVVDEDELSVEPEAQPKDLKKSQAKSKKRGKRSHVSSVRARSIERARDTRSSPPDGDDVSHLFRRK